MAFISKLASFFNRKSKGELGNLAGAWQKSLDKAESDLTELELQYVIDTATGEWLEEWGSWFEVSRKQNETDVDYRKRIKLKMLRAKSTIPALVAGVKEAMGEDTIVVPYETYKDLFIHNMSPLSGTHRLQDAQYTRLAVVVLKINKKLTPEADLLLRSIKGAGIRLIIEYVPDLKPQP